MICEFKKAFIIDFRNTTYQELEDSFDEILNGNDKINRHVCIEGIELYKLTRDEALHILAYTSHSAKWINHLIRVNHIHDCISCQSFIFNLDKALKKIPPTRANLLYRMIFSYSELPKYGDIIIVNYYLSTSIEDFGNTELLWRITPLKENSKGRDVSKITNNKEEVEVVFLRNSRFKVVEITSTANKTFIHLTEEK